MRFCTVTQIKLKTLVYNFNEKTCALVSIPRIYISGVTFPAKPIRTFVKLLFSQFGKHAF